MASLKWSSMALMVLLSLAICSANRVFNSMPEPKIAGEPGPRILDEISADPDMVWEGHIHSGGSGGGSGQGSGSGGGGGGGGGWSSGYTTPGYGGVNPGSGGGYGYGSGSGGGSNGGGVGSGSSGGGGNGGGGSGCGGGSGGNVPPKFEMNPEYPYYCQPDTCDNPEGNCPGFTVYLGRHG